MYHWEVPKVLARRLARIRERTGVPVARQLHRAVAEYVDEHDAPPRPAGHTDHRHTRRKRTMNSVNHALLLVLTIGGDGERSTRHHRALNEDWWGLAEARLPQAAA